MYFFTFVALAVLLGAFSVLGWAPFGWWPFPLMGYAGLFWLVLNSRTAWRAWLLGFAFGVGLHLVGSGWVFGALHGKAGMGVAPAVLSTLVFVAYLAIFTAVPCLFGRIFFRRDEGGDPALRRSSATLLAAVATFAALLVLGEWARGLFFNGFTSLALGYSLIDTGLAGYGTLKRLAETSDDIIRNALMNAQQVAYAGLIPARKQVMDDVAQANYHDDGTVTVDPVPLTLNEFTSFVSRYSGDKRTRFAEVAKTSANRDSFVPKRSWLFPGLYSDCGGATATGRVDFLTRRGGTELLGFDEWKAMDTLSEKRWVPKSKTDALCLAIAETPAGWGLQAALPQSSSDTPDLDPTHYDSSLPINPGSSGMAMLFSSSSWDYSGIPSFYDLSEDVLKQEDPRLQFAIRVRRDTSQTVTLHAEEVRMDMAASKSVFAIPSGVTVTNVRVPSRGAVR